MSAPPIHLVLPVGDGFGWGVVGKELTLGLVARRGGAGVRLTPVGGGADGPLDGLRNPLERSALRPYLASPPEVDGDAPPPGEPVAEDWTTPAAVLHAVPGVEMDPAAPPLRSRGEAPTLGYAVFENVLPPDVAVRAAARYDRVVAPSRWCAERLEERGVPDVAVVLHGVEPRLFHAAGGKRLLQDRFVVFSGGKAEMRKGQDLVIRAFAAFAQRHDDALLVASWYNPWPSSLATLAACPGFGDPLAGLSGSVPWERVARRLLTEHGVAEEQAVVLPPLDQGALAATYRESDVGLFPNRCEGASNLVLMEYMACGRPVIATDWAGHREILSEANGLPLRTLTPWEVQDPEGRVTARWRQPDLDEMVAALEWAYDHPEDLAALGRRAGEDLARWPWSRAAAEMDRLLSGG